MMENNLNYVSSSCRAAGPAGRAQDGWCRSGHLGRKARLPAGSSGSGRSPEPARKGRKKTIATRFGKIAIGRQQFHCAKCGIRIARVTSRSASPGRATRRVRWGSAARFNAETGARRARGGAQRLRLGGTAVRARRRRGLDLEHRRRALPRRGADPRPCRVPERVSDVAKAVRGPGDMAKALAKRWRGMTGDGRLQPAIDELKSHAPRREKAKEAAGCFESSRSRMDCPRYRAAGLPVGSGVVEGTCRSLVCERLEKSWMFRASRAPAKSSRCASPSNPAPSTTSGNIGRRRKKRPDELI